MFGEYVTMVFFTAVVLVVGRMMVLAKRKRTVEVMK
jgi:hypothetical protein